MRIMSFIAAVAPLMSDFFDHGRAEIAKANPIGVGRLTGERDFGGRRQRPKVGRNDQCPCGSGQKTKRCHRELC